MGNSKLKEHYRLIDCSQKPS